MIRSMSGIKLDLVHIRAFVAEGSAISVFITGVIITGVIARLDRATQYSAPSVIEPRSRGVVGPPPSRGTITGVAPPSRLLLHILDAGKDDALGAFAGVAEIEFIFGEEHRIAVD